MRPLLVLLGSMAAVFGFLALGTLGLGLGAAAVAAAGAPDGLRLIGGLLAGIALAGGWAWVCSRAWRRWGLPS